MAQKDTDLQKIKELIKIMEQKGLIELEIKHGDDTIFLKRNVPQQQIPTAMGMAGTESIAIPAGTDVTGTPATETSAPMYIGVPAQKEELVEIKSPIVGTYYATPSPDSEPYAEVGSHVEPQTVVCIVEAMKVMNEIKAEASGTIAEILVTNGQAVEYGQVLFRIKPD